VVPWQECSSCEIHVELTWIILDNTLKQLELL
jgi:hypothetical protein